VQDKALHLLAAVAVRVIWFVTVFVSMPFVAWILLGLNARSRAINGDEFEEILEWTFGSPTVWSIFAVVAAMVALFGPPLLHAHRMRGRGSLHDIKEGSRVNWRGADE